MKKLLSLIAAMALLVTFSFAQDAEVATPENEAGPNMQFESLEVDYGLIEQGSDPLRKFNFTNTGDEPLQITHAKGSCGCTVPSYPKEPIFPGESGVIEVRYDTKRIGKFVKRVTLTTNEGGDNRVLTIKGEVKKPAPEPEGVPASAPDILSPSGN